MQSFDVILSVSAHCSMMVDVQFSSMLDSVCTIYCVAELDTCGMDLVTTVHCSGVAKKLQK